MIPVLWRQRQTDLCEFKATLGYMIQSKGKQSQALVTRTFNPNIWESHTFNPNSKEVEPGRDMARWREEYKVGRERSSLQSV